MKKFSSFVINKRYPILIIILIITAFCAYLIPKVKVNSDLSKYLADDSSMKMGIDIMDEEFNGSKNNRTIRVMFKGLSAEEKNEILIELKDIEYVDRVNFKADSPDYNKGENTLYIINTPYAYGSPEESSIEKYLEENFTEYNMQFQNDNISQTVLPLWISIVAVGIVLTILFIMSKSWFEPFLFMFTLGIAITINMGTNILMGTISDVTLSIAGILQLVLSMDYSIILLSRYRQEKEKNPDKYAAMKEAFKYAFLSIIGSSVTTIVGLLALTFMSFKIGADIGIVLAKGVLISMLAVFTILPCLILLFDNVITKTNKKEFNVPTKKLASFSYRARRVLTAVFIVLFASTAILQSRTPISYILADKKGEIAETFPPNKMLVLVYENKDEAAIVDIADYLAKDSKIKSTISYPSTIDKAYTSEELVDVIKEFDSGRAVDTESLDIIYYHYHKEGALPSMSLAEFLDFLNNHAIDNENFATHFDSASVTGINTLAKFANPTLLTTPVGTSATAEFFEIEEAKIQPVFVIYHGKQVEDRKMSLVTFTNFFVDGILTNPLYASQVDEATQTQMTNLNNLVNVAVAGTELQAAQMAALTGMTSENVTQLYNYKAMLIGAPVTAMSLPAFLQFVLDDVVPNPMFAGMFSEEAVAQLNGLQTIVNTAISGVELTPTQLSPLLGGVSAEQLDQLFIFYHGRDTSDKKMSPKAFVDELLSNPLLSSTLDETTTQQLTFAQSLINATIAEKKYTAAEMTTMLSSTGKTIDGEMLELLYLYYGSKVHSDATWTMKIADFLDYLNDTIFEDSRFDDFIDSETKAEVPVMQEELNENIETLKGPRYSRLIFSSSYEDESTETTAFLDDLTTRCKNKLSGDYYLVGDAAMVYEMQQTFDQELILISLLTAGAIFVVVALVFRSLIIPAILVLLVQCGVFITVCIAGIQGMAIYFLALLIVECILMGAMIDYAILFTNYYREKRQVFGKKSALRETYKDAIHTIMTSGSIIVIGVGIVGFCFDNPVIAQICIALATGAFCALVLVLFILPGLLSVFDRLIIRKPKEKL